MRQIFFLVLLFITTGLFAQAPSNYTNINGRYRWIAGMFDSTFHIPKGTTTSLRTGGSTNAGALFYRTTDSSVYYYTGTQWLKVAGAAGFVPYTGATQNVNLGQFGLTTKFVQFDTSSQAVTDRRLQWSNAEGTLQFGMTNGSTITQRIGLEQFARVRNLQGDTIEAGDVVYISGASGDRAAVKLADNRADSTSSKTLGVATEQILPNDVGLVGTFGVVGKLNLSAFTAGDVVYLDSIPGKLTKVKPQAPYHMVFVGVVERANAGNGLLFVNVQNGYELEELHNVRITSPVRNNAILAYDSVGRLWKDTTLNALGGITGSGTSGQVAYFNGTNSITSSPTFAFTPTSQLLVNNSVTAASAIARGINATPSLTAAANNDVLVGLDIAPTFTNGAFTGVTNDAVRITGLSRLNGNVILGGANDRYIHYNTTSTILAGRDGSAVYFGYNFGSQLIDIGSLGSGNIRFRTSGNTIVESGKLLVGTSTDAGFRLDISGTARVQSFTTINAAPAVNAESALLVQPTTNNSASAASLYGIYNNATVNTILSTSSFTGIYSRNAISATLVQAAGVQGDVNISAGTTTTALGFTCNSAVTGTGTANTFVGYNFTDVFKSGSGAIARLIGMRIMNLTAGSTANVGLLFNNAGNTSVNGTWDIYSQSGNASYLAGNLLLGTTSDIGGRLQVAGTITATSAIARGVNFTNTLVAAANNDVLVGLDINPTFTNGAFSGITNTALRVQGLSQFTNNVTITRAAGNYITLDANTNTNNPTITFFKSGSFEARLRTSEQVNMGGKLITTGFDVFNATSSILGGFAAGTLGANRGVIAVTNTGADAEVHIASPNGFSNYVSFRENGAADRGVIGYANGSSAFQIRVNSATSMSTGTLSTAFFANGNVGIGTGTTDAGFRLDIAGTARVQGTLTAGSAGNVIDGTGVATNNLRRLSGQLKIWGDHTVAQSLLFEYQNNTSYFQTSNGSFISVIQNIAFTSGTASFNTFNIAPTINNTSTYVGINRGIFYNPTLTSLTGTTHRAIETVSGDVLFGTTSGNVMIGTTTAGGRFTIQPTNDQVGMAISGSSLTGSNAQSLVSLSQTWNTTGNPTAFLLNITNTASGATADLMELQVGGVAQFIVGKSGTIQTTAPAGGTAKPWKLGNVAVVSPTSPDRTIEVEIDGVTYYIHAKTTNN